MAQDYQDYASEAIHCLRRAYENREIAATELSKAQTFLDAAQDALETENALRSRE